MIIIMK